MSETINILKICPTPENVASDSSLLTLNLAFKLILRKFEAVFDVWSQARRNTLTFGGAKSRMGHICLRSWARGRSDRAGGGGLGRPPSHGRDFFKNESLKFTFVEHLKTIF